MKRFVTLILTCLLMISPLLAFVTTPSPKGGRGESPNFPKMWAEVQELQKEGKPQSAYKTVETILQKAIKEGHQGQALSARLMKASLHQEWAPDSFFTDIAELEALRQAEPKAEARAIYASILAEVYEGNRNRSQASGLTLTSEDMKEWTTEQYDSAAASNWQASLADIGLLAQARSKDWLPFVSQNTHSAYFKHDLLHILWQRYLNQRHQTWDTSRQDVQAMGEAVKNEYARLGNREAELLVALNLIESQMPYSTAKRVIIDETSDQEPYTPDPAFANLLNRFDDLPLCTEVYLRLMQTDAPDSMKVNWAQEALRRYPKYERIGEVRNQLNQLYYPEIRWSGNATYYPGKTYTWKLNVKNTTSLKAEVFRLNADFSEEAMHESKLSVSQYLRNKGKLVQTIEHPIAKGIAYENREDSMAWTAPDVGRYAVLFTGTTDERAASKKVVNDHYHLFYVSRLMPIRRQWGKDQLEVVVVDAESGHPIEGASVALYDRQNDKQILIAKQANNAEGRTLFVREAQRRSQLTTMVSKGEDHWLPEQSWWSSNSNQSQQDKVQTEIRLYTDRAIYRPGQIVHLSGIVYSQKHWDAHTLESKEIQLLMRDANWKEVGKQSVRSDEMGVFTADFVLPEGGLPGTYRISAERANVTFRVEEYKRPTFEVKMDEAPTLQWPQDSITLTGKAMGYNGVPVRDARVTGTYQFIYRYLWWYRHEDSPQLPIDTISTDETGTFRVNIPLKDIPEEALKYGLNLKVVADVLSSTGETREGIINVPLCTTPLRMTISMEEQQDRDRLTPPRFTLLTSTGKETTGTIRWLIVPKDAPKDATPLASGVIEQRVPATETVLTSITDAMRALPSGLYELRAMAKSGQDTASTQCQFMRFSMDDKQLARHTDLWCYLPSNDFDAKHPVRIQIGSSHEDVSLYYTIIGKDGVIKNKLIPLSNELRTLEIPYQEAYGDGVMVDLILVKEGICYNKQETLRLTLPNNQLKWEWTSFRDHLHPGDQETWTLRLTNPDGTPAKANLMAVLYDASLNQLTPHSWHMEVSRYHNIPYCPWQLYYGFNPGSASNLFTFPMKYQDVKEIQFDSFDARWLEGLSFNAFRLQGRIAGLGSRNGGIRMLKSSRAAGVTVEAEEMVMATAPMAMKASADMTDEVDASATLSEPIVREETPATASTPVATLRTNFNETAAFMPRLNTDPATGDVELSFTLPESLTTWQLLGIAHTKDMMAANIQAQAIASKELMARLHLPRFLRAGDHSNIRAIVQNLTDENLDGTTLLEVFDPETERLILKQEAPFHATAQGEAVLAFDYTPTEEYPIVAVRFTASTGTASAASKASKRNKRKTTMPVGSADGSSTTYTDGEQHYLAILPAKEWITESIEIQDDSLGTFTTDLSTLFNKDSQTATQRRLTVEYTTHPIWNVVQALPALRETDADDVLSLTSVLYANVLSAHIAATTPQLKTIIELWKEEETAGSNSTQARSAAGGSPAGTALTSPLAQNEELKQIILDETPWLREADNDSQRRAQLIDLFNENLAESRIRTVLQKLNERQEANGGFSWFPGMRSSELMTRLVAIELARLRTLTDNYASLTANTKVQVNNLLQRAVSFVANENARHIKEMKKAEAKGATINTGTLMHLHYVYITQHAGVNLSDSQQADVRYLLDHLKGSVAGMSNDERAMAAIVLKEAKRTREAQLYFDAMVEHTTTTPQCGTFFDYAGGSFKPTGHKVIIHTTAMEAVKAMAPTDRKLNSGMRRWLLQQKRTQMWESSICTADAIYALLNGAASELKNTNKDELTLNYNRKRVKVESDTKVAGVGYIHATYTDGNAPQSITVKRNSSTEGWGAVYAQYLTPIADASAQSNGLSVRRDLSSTNPKLGDKLTTRYVITADRDYEYVCLRAQRPAAAEPGVQVSGYHYQGGLGYYMAVRDAHTDYFFDRLPKGTYVLEETSFIDRTGTYTTGLTTLRCLYAPEYSSHTKAGKIKIRE